MEGNCKWTLLFFVAKIEGGSDEKGMYKKLKYFSNNTYYHRKNDKAAIKCRSALIYNWNNA